MPVDVSVREQLVTVEALESFPPDDLASYPFGRLGKTGRQVDHTFDVVVIENDLVEVTIVPALGGRVIRFREKGGIEFLPKLDEPRVVEGGKRGAELHQGIELTLDGERMLTALGPCQAMLDPAGDGESAAGVWVAQAVTGKGLGFHLHYSLLPGRKDLRVEARVFNRSWEHVLYNGGLLWDRPIQGWAWSADATFVLTEAGGEAALLRFVEPRNLAPRQVDSWIVTLTPYGPVSDVAVLNGEAAIDLQSGDLKLSACERRLGHKLVILTDDGQSLEMSVDLHPEHPTTVDLAGIVPVQQALLDAKGMVVLSSSPAAPAPASRFDSFSAGTRHVAWADTAMAALREGDYPRAGDSFERSLLYNADDVICWWGQAFARRLGGAESAEDGLLANAHYLAPLEPVLRAEALLSQPPMEGRDANPLLLPLAGSPESFVEVACLLAETGHFESVSRWINESLRHADIPMLRYLLADALLQHTPMAMDAAQQVQLAAKLGFVAPYPWRPAEFDALRRLATRFPQEAALARYVELASFVALGG